MFGTIPNILTMARMASAPVLSLLIFQEQYTVATAGIGGFPFEFDQFTIFNGQFAAGFVAAGILDFLDGYIARNYDQKVRIDFADTNISCFQSFSLLTCCSRY